MNAKKIDYLRLIIAQFDVTPISEKFKISELDVCHMLTTRYFNKFSKYDLFCFATCKDFFNTPIAKDLFDLGAKQFLFFPEYMKYLKKAYENVGLHFLRCSN